MADQNQKQVNRLKSLSADYRITFNTPEGERVLDDIVTHCNMLDGVTTSDTNELIIQAGRRDAAINILKKLNWDERKVIDLIN
ncbi:MAG: hypothetical protein V3U78_04650 [Thiotrichaceae bacterium]